MVIKFTRAQMQAGLVGTDEKFARWYVEDFMKEFLPQYYHNVSDDGKRKMVINGRRYAREFGLNDPEAQAHFVTLMWEIGANFYMFPGFHDVLARTDMQDMDKINMLFDGTVTEAQAVKAIMNPDDRYWYRENIEMERQNG